MEAEEGITLLTYAFQMEEDKLVFDRWIQGAQYQMSFDEFKTMLTPKPQKETDEIMADVQSIMNMWEVKRNRNL